MTSLSPNRIQAIEEKQNKVNSVFNINGSNTLELAYMRRICIREQKLHLILRKLEQDLPVNYIQMHCLFLFVWVLVVVAIQIVLIVYKSPLNYVCSGFWSGAFLLSCIVLAVNLVKNRSYNLLVASSVCHFLGILVCLGGVLVVNAMDLALFNTSCYDSCSGGTHQYLCLIMVVMGVLGCLICTMYVVIIELAIFRESRALNAYYDNA